MEAGSYNKNISVFPREWTVESKIEVLDRAFGNQKRQRILRRLVLNIVFIIPVSSLSDVFSLYSSLRQPRPRGGATFLTSSSFNGITMLKQSDSSIDITSDEIIKILPFRKIGLYSKNKANWRDSNLL